MGTNTTLVCKLGGSLLDLPDLRDRVTHVLGRFGRFRRVVVVGGGRVVDALRQYHGIHRWPEDLSHAMALRALRTTEDIALAVMGDLVDAANVQDVVDAWSRGRTPLLRLSEFTGASKGVCWGGGAGNTETAERPRGTDPHAAHSVRFVRTAPEHILEERRQLRIPADAPLPAAALEPLPAGWHVTSDSLAAWLAIRWAGELLLMKSVPPHRNGHAAATSFSVVDRYFPNLAAELPRIWWANLRRDPLSVQTWPQRDWA